MEEPNFWDNPEEAQEQMKQLSSMKEDRDTYQKLVSAKEDMETLIEMGQEEDDDSVVPEIAEMMEEFKASFDAIRIKTLLSGEFDKDNAIIKLNAGAGGTEACDWCGMLYRMYTRWAERKGFTIEELDFLDGDEGCEVRDIPGQRRKRLRLSEIRKRRSPSRPYFSVQRGRKTPDIVRIVRCYAGYRQRDRC